jgi:hypothetical protein
LYGQLILISKRTSPRWPTEAPPCAAVDLPA